MTYRRIEVEEIDRTEVRRRVETKDERKASMLDYSSLRFGGR